MDEKKIKREHKSFYEVPKPDKSHSQNNIIEILNTLAVQTRDSIYNIIM